MVLAPWNKYRYLLLNSNTVYQIAGAFSKLFHLSYNVLCYIHNQKD